MALKEESWHIRYYEYSYLFYIAFAVTIVAFYVAVYCLKVPTRRFANLKDILDNDPVINAYRFKSASSLGKFMPGQTSVPEHNLATNRIKHNKEAALEAIHNQYITPQIRQRKKVQQLALQQQQQQHHKRPKAPLLAALGRNKSHNSMPSLVTAARQIEQIVDDISDKLQASADDIITVHASESFERDVVGRRESWIRSGRDDSRRATFM